MIKIDLHMHSQYSSINGDKILFESPSEAMIKLKENGVGICAFTDHNIFAKTFYESNKVIANKFGIKLFPGVEVDVVKNNGQIGHILIIADDSIDLQEFETFVKKNFGKRKISTQGFFSAIKDRNFIVIPHVGKGEHFDFLDLKDFKVDAIETTNLENPKLLKYNAQSNNRDAVVAFSDTHAWNKYPQNDNVFTYVNDVKTFEELKQELQNKRIKNGSKFGPNL